MNSGFVGVVSLLIVSGLVSGFLGVSPPATTSWSEKRRLLAFTQKKKMHHCGHRTRCSLFFSNNPQRRQSSYLPENVVEEMVKSTFRFPYTFTFQEGDQNVSLTVRPLEKRDIRSVVPMCLKEYGEGVDSTKTLPLTNRILSFPWNNLTNRAFQKWFDNLLFGPVIGMSLELKIQERLKDDADPVSDCLICLERNHSEVVGMVEFSLQPLEPTRNPPPFPLPLWFKEGYCRLESLPPPNGWVSNLLVSESHRGKGYSKVLMRAVEGLARSWGCTSISLHVDPNPEAGLVPQSLYRGLGYKPVLSTFDSSTAKERSSTAASLTRANVTSGYYMVDDVLLLFLRKHLSDT